MRTLHALVDIIWQVCQFVDICKSHVSYALVFSLAVTNLNVGTGPLLCIM